MASEGGSGKRLWLKIILVLVFLPFIPLILAALLVYRLFNDAYIEEVKKYQILSWVGSGVVILLSLFELSELLAGNVTPENVGISIFLVIFFLVLGGLFIWLPFLRGRQVKRYELYSATLPASGSMPIAQVAAAVKLPPEKVAKELRKLFACGYLYRGRVDADGKIFIADAPEGDGGSEETVAVCRGCGAKNIVKGGSATRCEYCGMPL